jgi:hypothetical protein
MGVIVQVELTKLHHILEQSGVLCIEQRGRVVMLEAVDISKIWRSMCRRHV